MDDTQLGEFSYDKLRSSYVNLNCFQNEIFYELFYQRTVGCIKEIEDVQIDRVNENRIFKLVYISCRIPLNSQQRYYKIFIHAMRSPLGCQPKFQLLVLHTITRAYMHTLDFSKKQMSKCLSFEHQLVRLLFKNYQATKECLKI